jgi:hypothetical protein
MPNERRQGGGTGMTTPDAPTDRLQTTDPSVLLAILLAARRSGDRLLEGIARRELQERHGVRVSLPRRPRPEACHA